MPPILDTPGWYRALTLAERAALLGPEEEAFDRERAEERARYWRGQTDLAEDDLFSARLALDGLTPERFLRLLVETPESLRRRCPEPPTWLRTLERVYSRPAEAPCMPLGATAEAPHARFLELIAPLMADAYGRLCRGIESLCAGRRELPFDPSRVGELLASRLPGKLLFMIGHPLTLELRVASLEERLEGDTPQARFESFVTSLGDRATALEILSRYPVLARSVIVRLEQWQTASLELLERLLADGREIARRFSPDRDPGPVVELATDLSDRHHSGRAVTAVRFASGLRVVYKPRPLAGEARFQELVAWLNERGQSPPLPTLKALDRGTYGWVEHVEQKPCTSPRELARFYQRQGAYLALLYALEASDFHHENLIARGEHPVLVDLETFFQPLIPTPADDTDFVAITVLRSGLLPQTALPQKEGPDLSGFTSTRGQTTQLHDVTHAGTDRMQHTLQAAELEGKDNLPILDGEEVGPWKHREEILRGFEATYRRLLHHRWELLNVEGPLMRLADCGMRVLLRNTEAYARLLVAACHPDVAQDALARDRLFDKLWLGVPRYPVLTRALGAEQADLACWDVPHFLTRPDSRDLWTSSGERLEGFFQRSGLDRVRQRLEGLGEEDLARQSHLVRESLRTLRPLDSATAHTAEEATLSLPMVSEPVVATRFLAAALAIGRRLEILAVRGEQEVSWLHLAVGGNGHRHLEPVRADLYHGLGGIALFFAHLGRCTNEERFTSLARDVWATAQRHLDRFPESLSSIGAFTGLGGVVYTLTHLGLLWGEPELLARAEAQVPEILARVEADRDFDLIGGSAGAAAALLTLHRHRPAAATLEAAVVCGEHLLHHAQRTSRGLAWPSPAGGDLPLTGFGHGAAGIAWALAALAQSSGQGRFAEAARATLDYERSWFSAERSNWPDLRQDRRDAGGDWGFFHAWCHGAPGIGLGRLGLLARLDDPAFESEIRAALASTREGGFGGSHCLCHGDLGNLDLWLQAGARLEDEALRAEAEQTAARILVGIERDGPRCGVGGDGQPPGLMTGLAGIGYGLLRAAVPQRVPSVLLLETP